MVKARSVECGLYPLQLYITTSRFNRKHWKWVLSKVDEFNTLEDLSWLDHIVGLDSALKQFSGCILCNGWKRSKRILFLRVWDMGHLLWTIQYIRVFSARKGCVIWTVGHSHSYWHKWETVFDNFQFSSFWQKTQKFTKQRVQDEKKHRNPR